MPKQSLFNSVTDKLHLNENTAVLIVASVIGVIGGFGAVVFRELIDFVNTIAIGSSDNILETVRALPWYRKLIVPAIGGLIVGPVVYYFARETKGAGVPEVMEAVALNGGRIRSRVMFVKTFVSAVTIGTGGSVGREGPIVQIGSSMGSAVGRWLGVSQERVKILVACGAAAGIAATFNAPIAGVMFAVEIILGNYAIVTLVPLIMSSVMATIVGRWFFGDTPAFVVPQYGLASSWELGMYILLGLLTGIVAVGFIRMPYFLEDVAERFPIKNWLRTPLFLFLIGVMTIFVPQVYGVGYDTITQVLNGGMIWYMLLLLFPLKMLATSITLVAGGSGGIFAPSLFLGAVFGGLFGEMAHALFPSVAVSAGAYAVVGMSAMLAGTTHAPITAFLVIFELTSDYKLLLPLMLCSILASFIASVIKKDSIYTMKLIRRGVDVLKGLEVAIMQTTRVGDVMRREMTALNEKAGFNDVLRKVLNVNEAYYYVTDDNGIYQGSFNVHDIKEIMNEDTLADLIVAKDLVPISLSPSVTMDMTLDQCMRKFGLYDIDELPVVDNEEYEKLLGVISRRDIMNLYNREVLRQGSQSLKFIQSKIAEQSPVQSSVDLPEGFEIRVVSATASMLGYTLKELDIRRNYGVSVVAIKRNGEAGKREVVIPDHKEVLKEGDMLVVLGLTESLKSLEEAFR